MSYIKRLKLSGFKSFATPTTLHFEKGFNAVVGANGSGKSNVFDALCFVLGRMSSKGLRADKLGNLVFNGGSSSKASREAEVSIYLSNDENELMSADIDEIKITRVVNQKGQSKYLLNNEKVTRTEIVEVLARADIDPDGYNIILQGDIMRIVNMTPVERRELIEEISNISGYEEKREKALKKLEKVEADLKEADLLMEEKTKYLKELKAEKEQAEKFHQTKDDLRYQSLLLVKAKIMRNVSLKEKKEEELSKQEEKLQEYKDKLQEFEQETSGIDKQISELEKEIEIKSHEDFITVTNKITSLESQLESLQEKKAENKKHKEEIQSRIAGVKENIQSHKTSIKEIKDEIADLEKQKKEEEKVLQQHEKELASLKKSMSSQNFEELDKIDEEISQIQDKKLNKNNIRQDNAIQVEKLNTKLEHLQEQQKKLQKNEEENKEQIKELEEKRKRLKTVIANVSQIAEKNSELSAKYSSLQQEISSLQDEQSRLRIKTDASRELMASNKAVDTVLKFKSQDSTIHGSVAELASVPDKYSLALETIAGKSLFNIVVDNDKTAEKYINYLKDNKIGGATFLPLNKVNTKSRRDDSVVNKKGVVDYALNLIKFDKKYEAIFNLVFGDALVIEQIEDAKGIGIGQYRMVTLDGDVVSKAGAMSGGFKSKKKGVGAFQDDSMIKKLEESESRLATLRDSLAHVQGEKEDSEKQLYELRQEKVELESDVAKLEKVLSVDESGTQDLNSQIEQVIGDKEVIESSLKKLDKEIEEFDNSIKSLQEKKTQLKGDSSQSSVLEQISQVEEKRDGVKEKINELSSSINQKSIQLKNVLEPELKNLEKILEESNSSSESLKETGKQLSEEEKSLKEELQEHKQKEKELSKGYKEIISKRDKLKEDKAKLEKKYEKEFSQFDAIKEKAAQLRYAISEYDTLTSTLNDELEVLYSEIKAEFVEVDESGEEKGLEQVEDLIAQVDKKLSEDSSIDVKELQNKVNGLKTKLNSFGSINMKAVKLYDQLNEEFNALLEKREKLNEEKKEIQDFVAEMDEKKRQRFMETFEKLQKHFVEIYSKLSSKGEAELLIENEKDLFNSGVEIRVRLSKNNYLDIKSLSGGEKTITAISFIFAVQEFNPASFYIFDEVDAALDIMNSEKLGKLISSSAHKAQYIVVSHSEYLIQSAHSIYGVTMNPNKVSGVVSLDLENASEYLDTEEDTQPPKSSS